MESNILTLKEAARFLKCSESTIRSEFKQGKLKGFRVGNRIRFTLEELQRYVSK